MKLKITILIIFVFTLLAGILILIKINIPLAFRETQINPDAHNYVKDLQKYLKIEPYECAVKYLYYKSDYHYVVPKNIKVTTKMIKDNTYIVVIYDPYCKDDSEYETVDRIYLKKENNIWSPIKHEWSHKGRGGLCWTTEPTT